MRDLVDTLAIWRADEIPVVLAVVVDVDGSAPRPVGTAMAVAGDGAIAGNVSAGCVESAVVAEAEDVLATGEPRLVRYGITNDQAMGVGLTCGGTIAVLLFAPSGHDATVLDGVLRAAGREQPVALALAVSGPVRRAALAAVTPDALDGSLGHEGLDVAVTADARGMLAQGDTGIRHYGAQGGRRRDEVAVLIQSFQPPPRMIVFGGIDFAAALARLGAFMGYRVTVCDARAAFATPERFPDVDEVVVDWPHRYLERTSVDARTVLCVLTHDPKFDVPLLQAALRTPAGFIGVMGSRRSHAERLQSLRDAGVADDELDRVRAPVGLDLGARTPAETAVSIAAEIIALRWDGTGQPLRETSGAIHRPGGRR